MYLLRTSVCPQICILEHNSQLACLKYFGTFMWRGLKWEKFTITSYLDADWQHTESSSSFLELEGYVMLRWKREQETENCCSDAMECSNIHLVLRR